MGQRLTRKQYRIARLKWVASLLKEQLEANPAYAQKAKDIKDYWELLADSMPNYAAGKWYEYCRSNDIAIVEDSISADAIDAAYSSFDDKGLGRYPLQPIKLEYATEEEYKLAKESYRKEYRQHRIKLSKAGEDLYNEDYHLARAEYLRRLTAEADED